MTFDGRAKGPFFWSNGDAWGTCRIEAGRPDGRADRSSTGGLTLRSFRLGERRRPRPSRAPGGPRGGGDPPVEDRPLAGE
ncbi:MAG: hypothetical protein MZU79_04590 [Anaerotruncus sp.]|nr:hypothetical protein [Anaerotruncus sp.]